MKKISPYLTYAGTIPFIFCTVYLGIGIQELPLLGSVKQILSIYGLMISSFLAGSHWGQHLHLNKNPCSYFLPIFSNIILVLLWIGFLVLSFKGVMGMLVVAFIFLLMIDFRLFQMEVIARHYFQTRFFVSVTVIISLIVAGIES